MTAVVERTSIEDRLDHLSAQVEEIAADLRRQREAREQWEELAQTLVPVGQGAFDLASRELDELSADVSIDDAVRFARTAARSLPRLEALVAQLDSMAELVSELTSLSGAGVARVSGALAEADRKGYFVVARGGATVVDRVVSTYADEDFDALGDSLVRLLGMARRMAERVDVLEQDRGSPPPSTFALVRQLRDPETRRGMALALALLRAAGSEDPGIEPVPGTESTSTEKG